MILQNTWNIKVDIRTMKINQQYKTRPVRFIDLYHHDGWVIKMYGISVVNEVVSQSNISNARNQLTKWLENTKLYPLETYNIATLILHEGKEGCFAIINWWIDESMLQQFVYLAKKESPDVFEIYSDKGIITCVWEMAILWFERNAWVKHILMNAQNPDTAAYLAEQFNADV